MNHLLTRAEADAGLIYVIAAAVLFLIYVLHVGLQAWHHAVLFLITGLLAFGAFPAKLSKGVIHPAITPEVTLLALPVIVLFDWFLTRKAKQKARMQAAKAQPHEHEEHEEKEAGKK